MTEPNPGDLARRLTSGDENAWAELYEQFADRVWRWCVRLMAFHRQDAADVMQEAFLAAAKSARRFDATRGNLSQWMFGIVRRQAALHVRKTGREARWESAAQPLSNHKPEERLEQAERAVAVRDALAKLNDEHAHILMERYLEERSVEEIATDTGSTPVAVRSKLARARKAFREAYTPVGRAFSPSVSKD